MLHKIWTTNKWKLEEEYVKINLNLLLIIFAKSYMTVAGQGGGVIQGTASEAVLVVLLAARDKFLHCIGKNALNKLVVYASDQTHSALQKACQVIIGMVIL